MFLKIIENVSKNMYMILAKSFPYLVQNVENVSTNYVLNIENEINIWGAVC